MEEDKDNPMFDVGHSNDVKSAHSTSNKNLRGDKKPKKSAYPKLVRPNEKIRIDTLQDLNKLSFTQIKNLQIWNLEGRLFDQAFQDALHATKNDTLIKHNINSIEFQINYKTDVGSSNVTPIVRHVGVPSGILRCTGGMVADHSVRTGSERS